MGKIVDMLFELKEYRYVKPFRIAHNVADSSTNLEVTLILENGVEGKGEAAPSYRVNGERIETFMSLRDFILGEIKGLDVRNYRVIFKIMDGLRCAPSVKAAVQYAVLDALSVECGVPVYQLLGGARDHVETDKTVGIGTLEEMVEEARKLWREGFTLIKVKVGEDLREDIRKLEAISDATKGAKYIVDANTGYTVKEAITFAREMHARGIDVVVFEQPLPAEDIDGLKIVRFNSPLPVAADESARTRYDVLRLIKEEAVDFVNIKLMKSGISDALAIVEMATTANIGLMIGCMGESSLGISQSVHFASGTGVFMYCDLDSFLMLEEKEFRGKFRRDVNKLIPT
ncbi:MAG: dipeptide epimerase [Thermotogae bacterium]|nr:dipeptide epimerase [Thermotogota bacterium]